MNKKEYEIIYKRFLLLNIISYPRGFGVLVVLGAEEAKGKETEADEAGKEGEEDGVSAVSSVVSDDSDTAGSSNAAATVATEPPMPPTAPAGVAVVAGVRDVETDNLPPVTAQEKEVAAAASALEIPAPALLHPPEQPPIVAQTAVLEVDQMIKIKTKKDFHREN